MKVISDEINKLNDFAANLIVEKILSTRKDKVVVAIPGGRSVSGLFSKLYEKKIDWNRVHFFMVDERLINLNSKESNFIIAREVLFQPLLDEKRIKGENIHPFVYTEDIETDLRKYNEDFKKVSSKFDILILSSGEDGHIASIFPNNLSIKEKFKGFICVKNSPKLPFERMSASLSLIKDTDLIITLFLGETKRNALTSLLNKEIKLENCPAKIAEKVKESYVITDLKLD